MTFDLDAETKERLFLTSWPPEQVREYVRRQRIAGLMVEAENLANLCYRALEGDTEAVEQCEQILAGRAIR